MQVEQPKKRSPWYTYAWVWLVLGGFAYLLYMRWFYRDYINEMGLDLLCRPGKMEALKKRLEEEPELVGQNFRYGDTDIGLVHMVCLNHNLEGIRYLKSLDADFSRETTLLCQTPLSILSRTFYPNTLESIREVVDSRFVGAQGIIRPNQNGVSPIRVAIREYQPLILREYLKILQENGVQVDKDTLLQFAVERLRENNDGYAIVSTLVTAGAKPNAKNAYGMSARDIAREGKKDVFLGLMVGKEGK